MVEILGIQPSEIDNMSEERFHLWHQFLLMKQRVARIQEQRSAQRDELAQLLKQ